MTAAADTFALPSYDGGWFHLLNRAGLPMRSVSIPFAGQLLWRLDPRGYVWSAVTDRYVIAQQNLDGDTLLIVEREQRPIRVSAEERAAALDGLQDFIAAGGRVEPARIPSTKPALHGFTVDDRGYLWVVPQREAGGGRRPYDVFDPSGRYLGEVTGSTGVMVWPAAPVFRDDYVYGFTVDDLQVPYLVRLRIEGRASSPTPARAR
jgi:sugar lactone lactonase YvrE